MLRRAFNKLASGAAFQTWFASRDCGNVNGLEQALAGFLAAFENLDWSSFRPFFADDATIFHPDFRHRKRTDGVSALEGSWHEVFDQIKRDSKRRTPPYMLLAPKDRQITMVSPDIALVTFHLISATRFGRRSLLWRYASGKWKVVHLHASNFDLQPQ